MDKTFRLVFIASLVVGASMLLSVFKKSNSNEQAAKVAVVEQKSVAAKQPVVNQQKSEKMEVVAPNMNEATTNNSAIDADKQVAKPVMTMTSTSINDLQQKAAAFKSRLENYAARHNNQQYVDSHVDSGIHAQVDNNHADSNLGSDHMEQHDDNSGDEKQDVGQELEAKAEISALTDMQQDN